MNIGVALTQLQQYLSKSSISTAKLDTEVLLADELNRDRSWLLSHRDHQLKDSQFNKVKKQVARRAKHEPLAYIRGKQEFYRRDFLVTPDTLTPRPETEAMITLALDNIKQRFKKNQRLNIIDIGTGSGCIIITMTLELSGHYNADYYGLDVSYEALAIAKENSKNLNAKVNFQYSDLLMNALPHLPPAVPQILLANLPYVPNNFTINLAATHEPKRAIFGGKDGLDYYRILFKKARQSANFIYTESLLPQHDELILIAEKYKYRPIKSQGLVQVFHRHN